MFLLAFAAVVVLVVAALTGLALVATLLKLTFRVVLFPLFLGIGLLKFVIVPIVATVALVAVVVVAPVLVAAAAVLIVPMALLGAFAWGGLRLVAAL